MNERKRIEELEASLGAIHCFSRVQSPDKTALIATMMAIADECEKCIPQLKEIKIPAPRGGVF